MADSSKTSKTTPAKVGAPRAPARLTKPLGASRGPINTTGSSGHARNQAHAQEWAEELSELGRAFRDLFRSLSRLRGRDTHLGPSDVSHAQFELLIELFDRGGLPVGELATAAGLTPASVTQMLDHLVSSGHVERSRSESDRRVVVCVLTPKGRRKVQAKRDAWRSRWEQALGEVESTELRAATRVLEKLSTVFADDPDGEACKER